MNILSIFIGKTDPLYKCKVYRETGCSHIDGFLCDFQTCSMRLKQKLDIPFKDRFYKNNKTD